MAAFGVAAGLDPYLLFIVDFMAGNHDCSAKCFDYTSPTCRCHEGDSWKLYVRLDAEEGAGISGALLTVMVSWCAVVVVTLRPILLRALRRQQCVLMVQFEILFMAVPYFSNRPMSRQAPSPPHVFPFIPLLVVDQCTL